MSRVDGKSASQLINVGCTTRFWLAFRIVSINPKKPNLLSLKMRLKPIPHDGVLVHNPWPQVSNSGAEALLTNWTQGMVWGHTQTIMLRFSYHSELIGKCN